MTDASDSVNPEIEEDAGKPIGAREEPATLIPVSKYRRRPSWSGVIVMALIVSAFSSSASVIVYDRFFAQKVVTANISKFVLDQRDLYFQGKIDRQQYVNNLNAFIALLKSQPKNKIVILEDVVAANAKKLEPR